MLQLVVGEEGGFVRAVVWGRARDAAQRLDVRHRHAQDGQLVGLARERVAGRHHVAELGDVGGHFVPSPSFDFAVVLASEAFLHRLSLRFNPLIAGGVSLL